MKKVSLIPITVKCRIGVDDIDDYSSLVNFIQTVSQSGKKKIIIKKIYKIKG